MTNKIRDEHYRYSQEEIDTFAKHMEKHYFTFAFQ